MQIPFFECEIKWIQSRFDYMWTTQWHKRGWNQQQSEMYYSIHLRSHFPWYCSFIGVWKLERTVGPHTWNRISIDKAHELVKRGEKTRVSLFVRGSPSCPRYHVYSRVITGSNSVSVPRRWKNLDVLQQRLQRGLPDGHLRGERN